LGCGAAGSPIGRKVAVRTTELSRGRSRTWRTWTIKRGELIEHLTKREHRQGPVQALAADARRFAVSQGTAEVGCAINALP